MIFGRKKSNKSEIDSSLRIIDDSTPFSIKEAFRALHVNILYLPIEDKCKKIAVTSAFSGEGKSYTAVNLAITIAQNSDKKRVLIIDMDMRASNVRTLMEKYIDHNASSVSSNGLAEYLSGITEVPEITSTSIKGLSVLFAGAESANPSSLIASNKFNELLKRLEEDYDYIIIDTPPVTYVSDALLLAEKVNGYIISTRTDYSTTTSVSKLKSKLDGVNARIFGFVYTDERVKKNSYNT